MKKAPRPNDERPLHAIVDIVAGLIEDLVSNASRRTANRRHLSADQITRLRVELHRLLTDLDLQETPDSSDETDMTSAAVPEKSGDLTDGPFELSDHPVDLDEVEHLRRLGAPAWMINQFAELAEASRQSSCSVELV